MNYGIIKNENLSGETLLAYQTLCILGLGYIGLPTASTFATHGMNVVGVDTNPEIVHRLKNGDVHLFEPGLRTLVQAALRSGNLTVSQAPGSADAFIIAVPTPFKDGKRADLDFVVSAAESIVPHLKKGNLVILESTSPPRTTVDVVAPILEKSGLKAGADFHLAYSPERVLPGQILRELIENARVIGGIDPASAQAGRDLYSTFVTGEIILTDATTAEMVKLMENTYRDINIAAANEFARLADHFKVDIWEAIALANRHPRVKILNPGPGVGGHCISVDPWFLVEAAPDIARLIHSAREVNDSQPRYLVDFMIHKLGSLKGKRVAALGLAYKADVDDLRESPAITAVELLRDAGVQVTVYEPFKPDFKIEGVKTAADLADAVREADVLLLLVGHSQLKAVAPVEMKKLSKAAFVVDAINGWDRDSWQAAGFAYFHLGDGKH
jgi:UDP-N-acetyl-D-mannosaminuronic acid dehydrogenase